MADDNFKVLLGAELDLGEIMNQIASLQLTPITLRVEVEGDAAKRLAESIKRGVKDIDIPDLSKKLTDAFDIRNPKVISLIRRQVNQLTAEMAKAFDGDKINGANLTDRFDNIFEKLVQTIAQNSAAVKSQMSDFYRSFYDDYKNTMVYISDDMANAMGAQYFDISQSGRITRDPTKGVELNSIWDEMSAKHPDILDSQLANEQDQVFAFIAAMQQARTELKTALQFDDLDIDLQQEILSDAATGVQSLAGQVRTQLQQSIGAAAESLKTEILLDVTVNTEKIASDIQQAITGAVSPDKPIDISINFDDSELLNKIQAAYNSISVTNISFDVDENEIRESVRRALQNIPEEEIRVTIDEAELRTAISRVCGLASADITLNVDRVRLERDLRTALIGVDLPVTFRINADELRSQIRQAVASLNNLQVDVQVNTATLSNSIRNSVKNIPTINPDAIRTVNQAGQEGTDIFSAFGDTMRDAFSAYTLANLLERAIDAVGEAAHEAVETVKELNDASTDLMMATGLDRSVVKEMIDGYRILGNELGSLTLDVSSAADEWLRQGKTEEETEMLIKDSVVLSKVGQIDSSEATTYLTSAANGYKVAAEDVASIIDKLSAVDLESATDAGDLALAMSKTATSADVAGVSMDRLIGLIATVGETTQKSATTVGTSFQAIFSRMRDVRLGELAHIGDDGEIEDISNVERTLNAVGIKLRASNGEFRNFQTVLDDVAAAWSGYTTVQQAAIAKAFSGVRNQENFLVIMENYDKVLEYTDIAANSAGTAQTKFEDSYLTSLEAKTNKLKNSMEALAADTLTDDMYAGFLDMAKAAADTAKEIDLVETAFSGLAAGGLVYTLTRIISLLQNTALQVSNLGGGLSGLMTLIAQHPAALAAVAVTAVVGAVNAYQARIEQAVEAAKKSGEQFADNIASIEDYRAKIIELRTALDSGTLSEEQAYQAKTELYNIQKDLSESYGEQAAGVSLVNGELSEQLGLLNQLSIAEANSYLNENAEGVEIAEDAIEKSRELQLGFYNVNTVEGEAIDQIVSNYADMVTKRNEVSGLVELTFVGDAGQATETLNQFMTDIRQAQNEIGENDVYWLEDLYDSSSVRLNEMNDILEEYQTIYDRAQQARMQTDTKLYGERQQTAAKWMQEYAQAVSDYNKALTIGDTEQVEQAAEKYNNLRLEMDELLKNSDFAVYAEDVAAIGAELDETAIAANDFRNALNGVSLNDQNKVVHDFAKTIKEAEISDIDFKIALANPSDDEAVGAAVSGIVWMAEQAGISVESLIPMLTRAKILTENTAASVTADAGSVTTAVETMTQSVTNATAAQDNLNDALEDSVAASGLTTEEIENVAKSYQHLDSYDPAKLFEQTANGVHINTTELRRLDEELKKQEMAAYLDEIAKKQLEVNRAKAAGEDTSVLESELLTLQQLAAQYDGLTSAYQRWIDAQSSGEEGDMYRAVHDTMLERGKELYEDELYNSREFRAIADFYSNKDLSNATAEEVKAAYETALPAIERYFTEGREGLDAFVTDMVETSQAEGLGWIDILEDGSIQFNTGVDQEIANKFGIDIEAVQAIYRMMSEYRDDIVLGDTSAVNVFAGQIEELQSKIRQMQESGVLSDTIAIDYNVEEMSLDEIQKKIEELQQERVEISAETESEAAEALEQLIGLTQQAYYFQLNMDTDGGLDLAVTAIAGIEERIKALSAANPTVSVTAMIEGDAQLRTLADRIAALPPEVQTVIGVSAENIGSTEGILNQFAEESGTITIPVNYVANSEPESVEDAQGSVNYEVGSSPTEVPDAIGKVNYILGTYPRVLPAATQLIKQTVAGNYADGTVITPAHTSGNVSLQKDENALVNEVGTESRVRNGRWELIPGGAHVERLKKGDIIFNARQTKELLQKGRITDHGKAYASGTVAKHGMSAHSAGGWVIGGSGSKKDKDAETASKASSVVNALDSLLEALNNAKDWIEVRFSRLQSRIDLQLAKSENEVGYKRKNKRIGTAQEITTNLIAANRKGLKEYKAQSAKVAKDVGLSERLQKKVRNGTIDIEKLSEDDKKRVEAYQTWYEKVIQCKQSIEELKQAQKELAQQKIDNIVNRYDGIISYIGTKGESVQNAIAYAEARGRAESVSHYQQLKANKEAEQQKLAAEKKALEKSLAESVQSGKIKKGSEAWYEMQNQIEEVTRAYEQSVTEIQEFNNRLREIEWDRLDQEQEAVGHINTESEFLQKLIRDEDMYDDTGKVTEYGTASYGLHAIDYNVYMNQADTYAERMEKLQQEIALDPTNQDLIDEYHELEAAQRENILAAEDSKQAMTDLVKQGIEKQLSALKKLIDKYMDAIQTQKDLYDYQNNVKEQAEEIAKLQKRLAAYSGDNSEAGRLKREETEQALKEAQKQLEETQYDKYISDQQDMLDDLYEQYEEVLNDRLENIDRLIEEVISGVNTNGSGIKTTLETVAGEVGTTLSTAIKSVFSHGAAVGTYDKNYTASDTGVNQVVDQQKQEVRDRQEAADKEANAAAIKDAVKGGKKHPAKTSAKESGTHSQLWSYLVDNYGYEPTEGTTKKIGALYGISVSDKPTAEEKAAVLAKLKEQFGDPAADFQEKVQAVIAKGKPKTKITSAEKKSKSDFWKHIVNTYHVQPYAGMAKELGKLFGIEVSDEARESEKKQLLKAMRAKGYSSGTDKTGNEWAWINENGREILTLPNGSIFMPFVEGTGVVNNAKTEEVLKLANNADAIMQMVNAGQRKLDNMRSAQNAAAEASLIRAALTDAVGKNGNSGDESITNNVTVNISLPSVTDGKSFLNWAQSNNGFEKLIDSIVFAKMNGKSKLTKQRLKFNE